MTSENSRARRPSADSQLLVRLIPKIGSDLATWREERYEERATDFVGQAFGGLSAEDVARAMFENLALADDFDRAVAAATATHSEAKLRLLAAAVRAQVVALDDSAVDEAQQLLRVAIELEPIDLRALKALGDRRTIRDLRRDLQDELGVSSATAWAISARLLRLGLIESEAQSQISNVDDRRDDSVDIEEYWKLTPLSPSLMSLLRQR